MPEEAPPYRSAIVVLAFPPAQTDALALISQLGSEPRSVPRFLTQQAPVDSLHRAHQPECLNYAGRGIRRARIQRPWARSGVVKLPQVFQAGSLDKFA